MAETGKKEGKENVPLPGPLDDEDDFVPLKKKPKLNPEDVKAMFPQSTLSNCTFNITFGSKWLLQQNLVNYTSFTVGSNDKYYSYFFVVHTLFMHLHLYLKKVHYLFIAHLSEH